jgi:hypothetical protein
MFPTVYTKLVLAPGSSPTKSGGTSRHFMRRRRMSSIIVHDTMLFAISNVHGTMLFAVLISLSVTGHGKMLFAVLVLLSMMVHGIMLFAISMMVHGTMLFAIVKESCDMEEYRGCVHW